MLESNLPAAMVKPASEEMQLMQMTQAELRQAFLDALGIGKKALYKAAKILHVWVCKGFDDSEPRKILGPMYHSYLRLGSGAVDIDLHLAYGSSSKLWKHLSKLPLAEQKRLAAEGAIAMVEFPPNGCKSERKIPLSEIADDQVKINQLFKSGGKHAAIRTPEQQIIYLTEENRKAPPPVNEIIDGWEIDRRKLEARWVKTCTPPDVLPLKVMRALLGKLEA